MNKKITLLSLALILIALMAGSTLGRAGVLPDPQPDLLAVVGTAFTYQGQLLDGNQPANGTYDLRFNLFNALSSGAQVGGTQNKDDILVSKGIFNLQLDFGAVFDGTALWLEVAVRRGSSTGAYSILSPRQPFTISPYAGYSLSVNFAGSGTANTVARSDHLHLGQTWTGSENSLVITGTFSTVDNPAPLVLFNTGWPMNQNGLNSSSYDGTGVRGESTGATWADNGVSGSTNSSDSSEAGVLGISTDGASGLIGNNTDTDAATTTSYGVRAYSSHGHAVYADGGAESDDYGVYATGSRGIRALATGYAIVAETTSSSVTAAWFSAAGWNGVFAQGSTSGSGDGRGVWAESDSSYAYYGDTFVAGGYGLYTPDSIYVGGSCVGCTAAFVAVNGSSETLEPGDIVAVVGIEKGPTEYSSQPVLIVQKVDAVTRQDAIGVVGGRYHTELVTRYMPVMQTQYVETPDPEAGKNGASAHEPDLVPVDVVTEKAVVVEEASTSTEPAEPGDYITVIYRGMAMVKVDATGGAISIGDLVSSSLDGYAIQSQTSMEGSFNGGAIIGRALEAFTTGQGWIWVLVNIN